MCEYTHEFRVVATNGYSETSGIFAPNCLCLIRCVKIISWDKITGTDAATLEQFDTKHEHMYNSIRTFVVHAGDINVES